MRHAAQVEILRRRGQNYAANKNRRSIRRTFLGQKDRQHGAQECCDLGSLTRAPTYRSPLLHQTACPPFPPHHPPRNPTSCLYSILRWKHTNITQRKTWLHIRSFPHFKRAIPPRQSPLSLKSKSPRLANPRMKTDSLNGSPRL